MAGLGLLHEHRLGDWHQRDLAHRLSDARATLMAIDLEDLKTRVNQFNALELPGQPMMMHMGTSYLVNDLWRALRERFEADAVSKPAKGDGR
jgi:hypothetical protein